jgi:hypothetical protein
MKLIQLFEQYGITNKKNAIINKSKTIKNPNYDPNASSTWQGNIAPNYRDRPWQDKIRISNGSDTITVPDVYLRSSEEQYIKRYGNDELESWVILPGIQAWARLKMKVQSDKEATKWLYITLKGSGRPIVYMSSYDSNGLNIGLDMYNAAINVKPELSVTKDFLAESMINKMEE